MRTEIEATCGGLLSGYAAGLAFTDLETLAYYTTAIAAAVVVTASLVVYVSRPWLLKVAVTPLALSSTVYLYYSFGPVGVESTGAFCQLADSIGLIFLLTYVVWNRRHRNGKQSQAETAHKEKAVPTDPPQMKIVSHQGRH
jgi:RsiW-degrading membrane proteinase PrsW (M82 family)